MLYRPSPGNISLTVLRLHDENDDIDGYGDIAGHALDQRQGISTTFFTQWKCCHLVSSVAFTFLNCQDNNLVKIANKIFCFKIDEVKLCKNEVFDVSLWELHILFMMHLSLKYSL